MSAVKGSRNASHEVVCEHPPVLMCVVDCLELWLLSPAARLQSEGVPRAIRGVSTVACRPMSSHMSGSGNEWEEALVEQHDFKYLYPEFEKDVCFFDKPNHDVLVEQFARVMLYDEAVDIWSEAVELFRPKKNELQEMALWETFCEDLLRRREGTSGNVRRRKATSITWKCS